jgi:Protein of unknown function (DUF3054)
VDRTVPVPRVAVALDLVAVLVFVGIGRAAHAHGVSVGGMASTAWPFVTGLAVGWLVLAFRRCAAGLISSGALVCLLTVVVGMTLRVLADQGTAVAFVVVALCFLGASMCGWRMVARLVRS